MVDSGGRTIGLVVCCLADVGPWVRLYALDGERREGVMGGGRAGDSEEGGNRVFHLDRG